MGAEMATLGQGPSGWIDEQPQGGDRAMGPSSSCLIRWGSTAALSCQILFRPVLQAGSGSPGSAGALWGPLLGTPEADGVGRAGQGRESRDSRNGSINPRSPEFPVSHMGQWVLW